MLHQIKSVLCWLALAGGSIFTVGCSHSIKIKGPRFIAPITAKEKWGGFVTVSVGADTRVTLVDNIESNPPTRGPVRINQDADAGDWFGLNYLGIEAGLQVFKAVEVYADNSVLGLRWQFLNHGGPDGSWVATVQAGGSGGSQGTNYEDELGASSASSEITKFQIRASVGYQVSEKFLPYASFLYESYDVTTVVTNPFGRFADFSDAGNHQFLALGVMRPTPGFLWAVEITSILIDWDRAPEKEFQGSMGVRLGKSW